MIDWVRRSLAISGVAGLAFLNSCTTAVGTDPQPSPTPAALVFTLQTPINQIAANPRGKAVLDRDLPGMLSNPNYDLFSRMNLAQLASLSGGKLTRAKLNQVNADLAALSSNQ